MSSAAAKPVRFGRLEDPGATCGLGDPLCERAAIAGYRLAGII